MTWEDVRRRFPVLERYAYLNAGTFGPLARRTIEAIDEVRGWEGERGRGGRAYFERMLELRERVRDRLAQQLGVSSDHLALTASTTEGCNIVLRGLDLEPGDELVTTDSEHFGLIGPLVASGARVRIAPVREHSPEEAFDRIRAEISPRTRLLALSHVSWTSGNLLPVHELKRETGLPVLIDGAQSVGAIPVDASPFDFYTVSAQKWLCGPDSTGALAVSDPERLRLASPSYFSQSAYDLERGTFEPKPGAARFDAGWISVAALAGLDAALDDLPPARFERAREFADRCRGLLAEHFAVVTAPDQGTLVSFRSPGEPEELARRAYEEGVVIRDLPGTGLLRVSCGYWTSDDDLERLLAVLGA